MAGIIKEITLKEVLPGFKLNKFIFINIIKNIQK